MKMYIIRLGIILIIGVTVSSCESWSSAPIIERTYTLSRHPTNTRTCTPQQTFTVTEKTLTIPSASLVPEMPLLISTASVSSFQTGSVMGKLTEYAIAPASINLDGCGDSEPILSFVYERLWSPNARYGGHTLLHEPTYTFTETDYILKSMGYHLEDRVKDGNYCVLYKNDQILREWPGVCDQTYISFNHSKTDFILYIPDGTSTGWLVQRNGLVEKWDKDMHFWVLPVYVGDDLFFLYDTLYETGPREVLVKKNEQVIYRQSLSGTVGWDCLDAGLKVWEDKHWGINIEEDIVIDGESVSRKSGYDKTFALRILNGKPIYFFEKNQRVGISYDGQELPVDYAEIQHECYPVFQDEGACNHPSINTFDKMQMIWYFARRADMWYYVELELSG